MQPRIDDLSPFFTDPCWMFVVLAREAGIGVILRRGPASWWRMTLWDTERDTFQPGQWFRGHVYPAKSDVSPDGKLFVYFAGKYRQSDVARGYHYTWTAVSRPPYFTALALWPIGDTWGGHGVFLDNRTVLIATSSPSFGANHHPDHPPGPLTVFEYCSLPKDDPKRAAEESWRRGWRGVLAPGSKHFGAWRKTNGDLTLERERLSPIGRVAEIFKDDSYFPSRRRFLYTLHGESGNPLALFEAHWADFDQRGRLVATVGGRVLEGKLTSKGTLRWRQLAAMQEEQPERIVAPEWAQGWGRGFSAPSRKSPKRPRRRRGED